MRRVVDRPPTSNACTSSLAGSGETACNRWASEVPTDLTNFDPRPTRTSPDANRGERVEPGRHKILPRSPNHRGGPKHGGEGLTDLGGRAAPHGHVDFP